MCFLYSCYPINRDENNGFIGAVSYAIICRMKSLFMLCLVCLALPPYPVYSEDGPGRVALDGPDSKGLGIFRDSESPSAAFTVRNQGEGPLKITGIMKTCGCACAEADKDMLEPGATATVRVTIAPYTLEGAFSKSVFVLTDTAGAQPLRLTVTGESMPLFSVRPSKNVDTGRLPSGAIWEGAFELEASASATLGHPTVTSDCPAAVSAEAMSHSAGDRPRWKIPVKLSPPANGSFRCRIIIPVLSPTNRPPLTFGVSGRTGSELFAVPSALSIPVSEKTVARTLRLRISGSRGRKLTPDQLIVLPITAGLEVSSEAEPGGGVAVSLNVSPDLSKRIADSGPLQLKLSVPDTASAAVVLQPPDASAK